MQLAILLILSTLLHFSSSDLEFPEPSPQPSQPSPQPSQPSPQPSPSNNEQWIQLGISILVIIVGLFWVFLGYKLIRIVLFIAGFVVFSFLTFELLKTHVVEKNLLPSWSNYVLSAIAGIVGGFLFLLLAKIGTFLFGMLIGILATTLIFGTTPLGSVNLENLYQLLIILGVGLITGLLTVLLSRPLLILGTSFNGSFLIGNAIDLQWIQSGVSELLKEILRDITKHINYDTGNLRAYGVLGGVLVLTIVGIIVQWKWTAGENTERKKKQKEELNPLLTAENI